jgi:hypothetical protein
VLLEQHAPPAYAQALVEIAQQAPAMHARRQAIAMSRVAVRGLAELTGLAGITVCADPVARAVQALTQKR